MSCVRSEGYVEGLVAFMPHAVALAAPGHVAWRLIGRNTRLAQCCL